MVAEALAILLRQLGTEAAKGLVYWLTGRTVDATVGALLAKAARGQTLTPQEIEQLRYLLIQQAAQAPAQPQINIDELAAKVAEVLRRQGYLK
ncbi:MAG: hypothetical protein ACPL3C_08700 [Pyrobaculum sp.]|jgi:hypothetical protein|uniref:hypothetical protein n=1 Tax=Pyrobaculum sp. TaxID=2004705 RepID=UPI003CB0FBC8